MAAPLELATFQTEIRDGSRQPGWLHSVRSGGKEVLSMEDEQGMSRPHVEMRHSHTLGQADTHTHMHTHTHTHTHTHVYPSLVSSCLFTPQTLSLFGESIMKSIPHHFSNNVANKKKSYFDGVWFSAKRRVKTAILSAALWKCFYVTAVHRGKHDDSSPILDIGSCLRWQIVFPPDQDICG